MKDFNKTVPSPPSLDEWKFAEEFTKPVKFKVSWLSRKAGENEADLSNGVRLIPEFSDPDGLLDTAYADFQRFCGDVGMATNGSYEIVTEKIDTPLFETFRVTVESGRCRLRQVIVKAFAARYIF